MNETMNVKRVAGLRRFKPYPAYKDSGVEWLGDVPAHWNVRKVKRLCVVRRALKRFGDGFANNSKGRSNTMKFRMLILALALALGACSKVSEENFAKVQVGMSEQEVADILGSPTESDSVTILGVSGTAWQWKSGNAVASVQFVNGKVASKIWEKPSGTQDGGARSGY